VEQAISKTPEKEMDEMINNAPNTYEKKRLSKIQQNEERLVKLGLVKKKEVYTVKRFIGHKVERGNWKLKKIWEGYPEEEFTWESLKESLMKYQSLLKSTSNKTRMLDNHQLNKL